jgi:hypothetical protein
VERLETVIFTMGKYFSLVVWAGDLDERIFEIFEIDWMGRCLELLSEFEFFDLEEFEVNLDD